MKKLKSQYQQSVKTPHPNDFFWKRFPNIKSVYYKKFSTQQEKSFYSMHCVEYKNYPLKIRVARGTWHVVLVLLKHGMTFQPMSTKLPKAGSIILKERISTIRNMCKNKKWERSKIHPKSWTLLV